MDKIKIKLIVGLGNPGHEYENVRHNTGFLTIDNLQLTINNCSNWKLDKKTNALISSCQIKTISNVKYQMSKVILAKPQTFINKSGDAVLVLSKFFKIKPENILVVHDDIDILWSNFKLSFGRSSAGHKGVESIIKALKTKNFWRLRIGIQPTLKKHMSADKIILKKFTPAEFKILNQTIKKAISELESAII
ncbi:MAG: aminoacyl-tRNA hydrolase [Candidatus Azambacteria bacterium]|nr:aminoacyl-tRNA hydrolase [Candidatus Azambacteria bacterium]